MRTATNVALYGYWNSVRAGRIAPRRFEIEPARIADVLSDTFILEFHAPSSFVYRLAGTRICETTGREMRGASFLEGWRETDKFVLQRHLTSVRKLGAVARFLIDGVSAQNRMARFEVIILPLLHNGEAIDRFLGAFVALNPQPWLATTPVETFRIVETELTYPAEGCDLPEPVLRAIPSDAPQPAVFPGLRTARIVRQDRRQFRVYEGGRSEQPEENT
ncbi:MAG: PAS domain-containing protein [Alphaproteobacteria bacterium]|nr:PAS domain-containing protein [Alphaproteobacteria bacterium]